MSAATTATPSAHSSQVALSSSYSSTTPSSGFPTLATSLTIGFVLLVAAACLVLDKLMNSSD